MFFLKILHPLKFIALSLTAVFLLACGYPGIVELVPLAITPTPPTQLPSQSAGIAGGTQGVGGSGGAVSTPITSIGGGQPPKTLPTTGTILNLRSALIMGSIVLFLVGGGWFIYQQLDRY
jgi:hypothetical protein